MSQINYDALHTFDKPTEDDDHISTPFSTIVADKYPAIAYTEALFQARPQIFGNFAASLVYILNSGTSYKPEIVYMLFQDFIKYAPQSIVKIMRSRKTNVYEFCPNFLVLWAKILRTTKTTIAFEPIMKDLNAVLNEFFVSKKVQINGSNYDLSLFRPICYTRSGENYFQLIPYLVYVMTFLIYCQPYSFNEAQSESSRFGFLTSVNNYFQQYYTAFKEDTQTDILRTNIDSLDAAGNKYLSEMIQTMLHPDRVIKLRNSEIEKTPDLLDECINDQMQISRDTVKRGFQDVLSHVVKIIIQQNPLKRIFEAIPLFKTDKPNIRELLTLTNYCLGGGNQPFAIEYGLHSQSKKLMNSYTMNNYDDEKGQVYKYPEIICGQQELKSNITPLNISRKAPLTEYDLMLNLCTAYVRKQFELKRNDILDENPITIEESMLNNSVLAPTVRNLFLNGVWAYDNVNVAKLLTLLMKLNVNFATEIRDLLSLGDLTLLIYNNKLASIVISTLCISYINDWLLATITNGYSLQLFSPYSWIVQMPIERERIYKLCDMTTSLMYIYSKQYSYFVNENAKEFVALMANDPIIQQPYVKHLNDLADVYAIGGCELYRWAVHENPIVRGCMWHYNVFGWNENLETFYLWASKLDNSSLMELIETNINDTNVIESSLKTQFEKIKQSGKQPVILNNYEFDDALQYREKRGVYVLGLTTSAYGKEIGVLNAVVKRVFRKTLATQATTDSVHFKRIQVKGSTELIPEKAHKNGMNVDGRILPAHISEVGISLIAPTYDITGKIDEVKVIYTSPAGHRLITLTLGNSRNMDNQTMLIYTKTPAKTRFGKYQQ